MRWGRGRREARSPGEDEAGCSGDEGGSLAVESEGGFGGGAQVLRPSGAARVVRA